MYLDPNIFNNTNYKLALIFLYSLFFTFLAATYLKYKFLKKNFVVTDMYKKKKPILANLGGTAALVGILASIVISQVLVSNFSTANLLIFFFIVIIHALSGLIDDLINTSNIIKIVAPYFMALPVFLLVQNTTVNFFGSTIDLGLLFVYIIAPVFLLVITNLVNMHSGYNGLASGVSGIIMLSLIIRSIMQGQLTDLYYILPVFAALIVLWYYDKYPAKMIWGNIGSMMMGSAIGAYIIVTHAYTFGMIIFIPHIVDFLLYFFSVAVKKDKFLKIKFGKLRSDGTIDAPTPYKLKFLFPYYFRLTEKQTTLTLYGTTAIFCLIGLLLGV